MSKINSISEPVKSQFGYHIIRLDAVLPAKKLSFSEAKQDIENYLITQKQREKVFEYIAALKSTAVITYGDKKNESGVLAQLKEQKLFEDFNEKDIDVCYLDGKPIIRLYTTSWSSHTNWSTAVFNSLVKEYGDKIVAHHWSLDTGDDLLTPQIETMVPSQEVELFKTVNSGSAVPAYVFGCKFVKLGNKYENEDAKDKELAELKKVVDYLIEQK